jgi:hypothetical protein
MKPNPHDAPNHNGQEDEITAFQQDVAYLVNVLKESFESDHASYHLDEQNDILFVELEGLDEYTEEEIAEIAEPILEELDLDVEETHLVPYSG